MLNYNFHAICKIVMVCFQKLRVLLARAPWFFPGYLLFGQASPPPSLLPSLLFQQQQRICKTWLEVLIKGSETPPPLPSAERTDERGERKRDWNVPWLPACLGLEGIDRRRETAFS